MNKGLYKHCNNQTIYWYETWSSTSENSGRTIAVWKCRYSTNIWDWQNSVDTEDDWGYLIGSSCLAKW